MYKNGDRVRTVVDLTGDDDLFVPKGTEGVIANNTYDDPEMPVVDFGFVSTNVRPEEMERI